MKRALMCCTAIVLALSSVTALSAERNTFYLGLGIGALEQDTAASFSVEDDGQGAYASYKESSPTAPYFNFIAGFNIFSWFALEAQYGQTQEDRWLGNFMDVTTTTTGLYGVLQKGDDLYGRLRLGLAEREIDITTDPAIGTQSELNGAIGLSIGQVLPVGQLEIMWMYYPKMDIDADGLEDITDVSPADPAVGGIKVDDRWETQTWSIAYLYTF